MPNWPTGTEYISRLPVYRSAVRFLGYFIIFLEFCSLSVRFQFNFSFAFIPLIQLKGNLVIICILFNAEVLWSLINIHASTALSAFLFTFQSKVYENTRPLSSPFSCAVVRSVFSETPIHITMLFYDSQWMATVTDNISVNGDKKGTCINVDKTT